MIRAATVTDVTPEGVWVVSSWLSGRTGPLFAVGLPAVGDAVLVVRTDDDALVVVGGSLGDALTLLRSSGRVRIGAPAAGIEYGPSGPLDMAGSGSPEGVVSAPVGSTWRRTDGGSGSTFYVKESGYGDLYGDPYGDAGNTGWVGK